MVPTPPIDPTSRGSSNNGRCGDPELWGTDTPFVQSTTRGTTDDTDCDRRCLELRGTEPPDSVVDVFLGCVALGRVALPLVVRERVGCASVSLNSWRRLVVASTKPIWEQVTISPQGSYT